LSAQGTIVPTIPAISGTVVDALTGKPVAGVDVILRASLGVASLGDGGPEPLRYENSTTSPEGRFYFPPKSEPKAAGPLSSISELSLSVNRVFVPVAEMQALFPTEGRRSDGNSDVTWLAQHATIPEYVLSNSRTNVDLGRLSKASYFPASIQLLRDCFEWAATCVSVSPVARVRVNLIPVFDDPAQCRNIRDPEDQERCRQLNTYRAAFLRMDTPAQLQEDKRLCESVDGGRISRQCLEQLSMQPRRSRAP
jgi:hypothetical protein